MRENNCKQLPELENYRSNCKKSLKRDTESLSGWGKNPRWYSSKDHLAISYSTEQIRERERMVKGKEYMLREKEKKKKEAMGHTGDTVQIEKQKARRNLGG